MMLQFVLFVAAFLSRHALANVVYEHTLDLSSEESLPQVKKTEFDILNLVGQRYTPAKGVAFNRVVFDKHVLHEATAENPILYAITFQADSEPSLIMVVSTKQVWAFGGKRASFEPYQVEKHRELDMFIMNGIDIIYTRDRHGTFGFIVDLGPLSDASKNRWTIYARKGQISWVNKEIRKLIEEKIPYIDDGDESWINNDPRYGFDMLDLNFVAFMHFEADDEGGSINGDEDGSRNDISEDRDMKILRGLDVTDYLMALTTQTDLTATA
ncbi:hypothetical protein X943_001469 [Babesia divergens]|uniref:Uncharacterized protein n=1 Tax=Babesia divergens TaxID=32595 RepID=A0AAD9GCX7_BABDI|nr:hypothetical protein X943_001469 [Babesia divergens]